MGSTVAPSDLGAHWSSPLSADCLGRHCASRQLSATPLPPSGPATCSGDWKLPSLIIRCSSSASLPGQPTSSAAVRSAPRARPASAGAASPGEEWMGGGATAGQLALSARPAPQASQLSSLMPCALRNTSDAHFGPPPVPLRRTFQACQQRLALCAAAGQLRHLPELQPQRRRQQRARVGLQRRAKGVRPGGGAHVGGGKHSHS